MVLGTKPRLIGILQRNARADEVVVGWGRKASGRKAVQLAGKAGVPFLLLEDGFLRSVDREGSPLSLTLDDKGIYYDASGPSTLEEQIAEPLNAEDADRARRLIDDWRRLRLSKYNAQPDYAGSLPERYVLVVDQVAGDLSVGSGLADGASFTRMLDCALAENPDATVIVKVHPDVRTRAKAGYFSLMALEAMPRVMVIADACHPVRLIENAEAVYVVTSQVGFEALIWGRPVRAFGMPFFAGWGLTTDELTAPLRRSPVSLEQLVFAALVKYPRYADLERRVPCEAETAMKHVAFQREMRSRFAGPVHALGFSRSKQLLLRRFLSGTELHFARNPQQVPAGATVAVWGATVPDGLAAPARILRLDDGLLPSSTARTGLGRLGRRPVERFQFRPNPTEGQNPAEPISWVIDDLGLYCDATRPSRLETLLQTMAFDAAVLHRAAEIRTSLRAALVTDAHTKEGQAGRAWSRPTSARRVILVPGQAERDGPASCNGEGGDTDIDLLKAVRAANPDAYVVYVSRSGAICGRRNGSAARTETTCPCDEVLAHDDPCCLLDQVDEVHTFSAPVGFAALIAGRSVVCYGQPFYSGWGLTTDRLPHPRRSRRLSLDELVAASLILYPTYVSQETGAFITPEQAIEEWTRRRTSPPARTSMWRFGLWSFRRAWERWRHM